MKQTLQLVHAKKAVNRNPTSVVVSSAAIAIPDCRLQHALSGELRVKKTVNTDHVKRRCFKCHNLDPSAESSVVQYFKGRH